MISYFIRILRLRFAIAFCYTLGLVTLLLSIPIRYFRSSSDADGDLFDAKRVEQWQQSTLHNSCYMSREGDALELLPDNITLPENSIFFHETSCNGDLTSRQACVVESTARAHPSHQINVFFISAVSEETLKNGHVSYLLKSYKNVKLARVLIVDYASGTPLASMLKHMPKEDVHTYFMSKIMKYLTLYKYGGIYLSLDVIVAQKLNLWTNWAVRESPHTLSADMFAFSKNKTGRMLARRAFGLLMTELKKHGNRDLWSYSGSVISDMLPHWCTTKKVQQMELSKCNDLEVYGPKRFYPIQFHDRKQYFEIVDWAKWKKKFIYTYFVWHRFTKYSIVRPGSLYGRIANEYCPVIYHRYRDKTGVWFPDHSDHDIEWPK